MNHIYDTKEKKITPGCSLTYSRSECKPLLSVEENPARLTLSWDLPRNVASHLTHCSSMPLVTLPKSDSFHLYSAKRRSLCVTIHSSSSTIPLGITGTSPFSTASAHSASMWARLLSRAVPTYGGSLAASARMCSGSP